MRLSMGKNQHHKGLLKKPAWDNGRDMKEL
jgi:hypothetical protein